MPIYEFECPQCALRFDELASAGREPPACPACGSPARRLLSAPSPPGRQPRGPRVADSESRRSEREAARGDRLAEAAKQRARGESPTGGDR